MNEEKPYRKIARNTAILGGAQIVQMLMTLIRAKVVAVLLGPMGMGINAMLGSGIAIIQQLASCGIFQSSLRDLSSVYAGGDCHAFARLRRIFGILSVISGLVGIVLCLLFSPLLSFLSFGNLSYVWAFVALSVSLLFSALQSGSITLLQATGNLKLLSRATVIGAVMNLILAIPLLYFLRLAGIVPVLILAPLVLFLTNRYYERRVPHEKVERPPIREIVKTGKPIVQLGGVLMLGQLMMSGFTFLLNGFISNFGSVSDVGFFQAASSICLQSMVIIQITLVSDYYPRLSSLQRVPEEFEALINNQLEMIVLMIVPLSVLLFAVAPWAVRLLFTREYLVIVPLLRVMSLALLFRAVWIVLGFIALAKGDKLTFFFYEALIGHGVNFVLNVGFFYFLRLDGLGFSYLLGALFMVGLLSIVIRRKYGIHLRKRVVRTSMGFFAGMLLLFAEDKIPLPTLRLIALILTTVGLLVISLYKLNTLVRFDMLISRYRKHR